MSYNYRIVEYNDGSGFGLHEVFYDKAGKEKTMTSSPATFAGETPEDIRGGLMMARMDAMRRPIFQEPDDWE